MKRIKISILQKLFLPAGLMAAMLFGTITRAAAQCNCTFTITPTSGYVIFDGAAKGVKGGDVICVQAGSYGTIKFVNVKGSAGNPVIIKNCGGQVLMGGPTVSNGMLFGASKYVHVTGTGVAGLTYGLKVIQTVAGSQGLAYAGLSSDVEIDHMEIAKAGYTGIMAKTDPSANCADVSAVRPNFTLYNVSIHDNYIHDCGGEGIYLGDSFYNGTLVFCGSTQYCHEVRGVRIYNNRFENTGREAIQVGSAVSDVEIYSNKIYNYGTVGLNSQNGGVQMGVGTAGRLYNNFIKGGTGPGIAVQGIGGDYVYNNVIVNPGQEGITINTRPTPLSTDIVNKGYLGGVLVMNNTIVNGPMGAIIEYQNDAPGNVLFNNLIVACATPWDRTITTDWQKSNNVSIPLLANAKFVNPGADDYRLLTGSPAIDVGKNVSSYGVTFDADKKNRPVGTSYDVGAYEFGGSVGAPVSSAGADKTLTLPTNSTALPGSASDAGGSITSYAWTKQSGPAATLSNASTATLTLTALVAGTYVFRLTATDNSGLTGYDEVTVTVTSAGSPPVVNVGADKALTLPANSFSVTATASDPDGTITAYSWTRQSGPSATLAGATTKTLSASSLLAGTYLFRLTVTDNSGKTAFDEMTVIVSSAIVTNTVLYRVNAGGALIAASPMSWAADTQQTQSGYLDAATANYTCGTTVWSGSNNTTGAPDNIFGPNRYCSDLQGGPMRWNFPVTSGTYEVRLFFAETPYAGGVNIAGARKFNVGIEGITVLTNYDIFASVGMGAAKKVFQANVTDGVLNINFVKVVGKPQVNGIEIISLSGGTAGARTTNVAGEVDPALEKPIEIVDTTLEKVQHFPTEEEQPTVAEGTMVAYPNPFHDTVNIQFETEQETVAASLMDLAGHEVYREIQNNVTLLTLDMSRISIPDGTYVLVVKLAGQQYSQRVIKL